MRIFDRGTFEVITWGERKVEVELHGERLSGAWALFPIGRGDGPSHEWMIHRMGEPLDPAAEPMPAAVAPMLASPGPLPEGDAWAFEVKWDGVRALCHNDPRAARAALAHGTGRHRGLSRARRDDACAARAPGDPRWGDRRLRRRGTPQLPGAAAPDARAQRGTGAPARARGPGHLRDLRPAVARRPLAHGPALRRAPRAPGRARAARRALADPGGHDGQRGRAARGGARPGPRGRRRQAPRCAATFPAAAARGG